MKASMRELPGWEGAVQVWIEQGSSIMLRARTHLHGDPVELTSPEARRLARILDELADELDARDT